MSAKSSNCSVSAKFFPMLVETPYFWGVINSKTYLNLDLGSKFFFLSSLAYKLVNLLVFDKISCKMSKNWSFIKIIGQGLNFTYEFEVCYRVLFTFLVRLLFQVHDNQIFLPLLVHDNQRSLPLLVHDNKMALPLIVNEH